jgi:2-amino-4-hydroxy-6-hydroxymethyldihydropteridine diphosphokinase
MLVLVGVGSNQGDSVTIVRSALSQLRVFAASDVRASGLWRTSPVDCPPGSNDFINAVAAFEPLAGLSPEALITELKLIERRYGRVAGIRNAPRALDLDLLLFGDEVRENPELTLPHPRAARRRFVLAPAVQVAPELIWPGTGSTLMQLLAALDSAEVVTELEEPSSYVSD